MLSSFRHFRKFSTTKLSYPELLNAMLVINKHNKVKFGVENTKDLQEILGRDYKASSYRSVHVAGSNGKGSVSLKIAKALEALGYRVGLFTSPHLSTWRERIQVNGDLISEKEVEAILPHLLQQTQIHNIPATFFELTTLLAFGHFAQKNVDYAVFEVGLGGRLDSTNVITPSLSVITSISLEHTQILGDTIEKIALEKCGIIKPGVPVLIGPNVPRDVADKVCQEKDSVLFQLKGKFPDYDIENTQIAQSAIEILSSYGEEFSLPPGAFSKGQPLEKALHSRPPCRFEQHDIDGTTAIFDVGHNPDALLHLAQKIQIHYRNQPIRVVIGFSKDKDIKSSLEALTTLNLPIATLHLVQANSERAATVDEIVSLIKNDDKLKNYFEGKLRVDHKGNVSETVKLALKESQAFNNKFPLDSRRQLVLVCGTFFIMSDARGACGIAQEVDPVDLNERFGSLALQKLQSSI